MERIDGRRYAGGSRTRNAVPGQGGARPDVAEAQCLPSEAGFSPGGIDGIFGPLTEHTVKRVRHRAGLVVNGHVGPHPWRVPPG